MLLLELQKLRFQRIVQFVLLLMHYKEENNMKIIKMALFLAVVAALAGGALSAVNNITAPIIAENAIASELANLEVIFPDTDEFLVVENCEDESGLVVGVYEAVYAGMAYN